MLTGIKLGNFKAFAETQDIPIRPLTLIFGANSSGKSSIIHSLLMAHHACETNNLNVHRTRIGGESVDLGGFQQYIHGHDPKRIMEFGLEFKPGSDALLKSGDASLQASLQYKATVSYRIGLAQDSKIPNTFRPSILGFNFQTDNQPVLVLKRNESGQLYIESLDITIYMFVEENGFIFISDDAQPRKKGLEKLLTDVVFNMQSLIPVPSLNSRDLTLWKALYREEADEMRDLVLAEEINMPWGDDNRGNTIIKFKYNVNCLMEYLGHDIGQLLRSISYLGPLRMNPHRHLSELDDQEPNWQSGGGQAWYRLKTDPGLLAAANRGIDILKMPYELQVKELVDRQNPDAAVLAELSLKDKRNNISLSHRDVGIGVSQIIPVIATLFSSQREIIAIEQPEIHLHPAAQADLGDLVIQSALGTNRNTLLLETHSEHLILRILRRIRETTDKELAEGLIPVKPDDVAVLYVQPGSNGSKVMQLRITEDGDFLDKWPQGFFEERAAELF